MAKSLFEELGGKYERQRGLFDTVLNPYPPKKNRQ